jgi:hypothetical protein
MLNSVVIKICTAISPTACFNHCLRPWIDTGSVYSGMQWCNTVRLSVWGGDSKAYLYMGKVCFPEL